MEDARSEHRIGFAYCNRIGQMFRASGPPTGNNRDGNGIRDRGGDLQVIPILRAISVHTGQDDFAGPQSFDLLGPGDGFESGGETSAVNEHFPALAMLPLDSLGIDINDDALATELGRGFADQIRVSAGCGINGNLVGPGQQEGSDIIQGADSSTDG